MMFSKQPIRVYIYSRVSTVMQVEGYSLDAQKERMRAFAAFNGYEVVREYEDAGKSGRSIESRFHFQEMIKDIKSGKDGISYILVYKLSRFGRNAADVLNTLQVMQDYGVNLICVEDGIDSSKDAGKLIISVLSAVAEIEKENIRIQTMEGRMQKAREGKWNGGFAPYGYKIVDGKLEINEEEAKAIRIIFDQYINTDTGANGISKYLENHGIRKIPRQNGKAELFSAAFVRQILRNPVYCGNIAYGRRKIEKVIGTRDDYHLVPQKEYLLVPNAHQPIVSEEYWNKAQKKLESQAKKYEKVNSSKNEKVHLLSGIVKCPECGAGMHSNVNKKKKKDGSNYKDFFFYRCKHRDMTRGHKCDFNRQIKEAVLDSAVIEVIGDLVKKPKFAELMRQKINTKVDTTEIDAEINNYTKQLRHNYGLKDRLIDEIDGLDWEDKHYERRKGDLDKRLDQTYNRIDELENELAKAQERKDVIEKDKITGDNIYKILLNFENIFSNMDDLERKQFIELLIDEIQIHPEKQENGQWLKSISFKLPIIDQDFDINGWVNNTHVSTCFVRGKRSTGRRRVRV